MNYTKFKEFTLTNGKKVLINEELITLVIEQTEGCHLYIQGESQPKHVTVPYEDFQKKAEKRKGGIV